MISSAAAGPGPSPARRPAAASLLWLLILLAVPWAVAHAELQDVYQRKAMKRFADVVDDAEFAITERNFRITGRLHIGSAIRERGNPSFPDNEVLLFCNVTFAERMLTLNPEYVNFCPGRIAIRGTDGAVIISAPLVPPDSSNAELNELVDTVNKLIIDAVDFAAEEWLRHRQ